jgi:cytochrome P450
MPAVESPRAPVPGPWVIHDHAGARAALADPALSRQPLAAQSALPLRGHVLNSEGATHRALRAAVADALGTRVDRHAPGIGAVAVSLLDDVVREASGGAPVDMASRFVVPLTLHAVDVVMGLTDAGAQLEWWCRWALEVDVAPDGDPLRRALEHGASEMMS